MGSPDVPISHAMPASAPTSDEVGALVSSGRRVFGWILVAGLAGLIFLGAQVKSHDAGLAEPDWPLGYGQWMPRMVGNVFHEHGHRVAGAIIGLLTIVAAVWTARSESRPWLRKLGWTVLALVCVQGLLGGLTVRMLLPPPISVTHGALAQTLLCLAGWWALAQGRSWTGPLRAGAATTSGPGSGAIDGAAATAAAHSAGSRGEADGALLRSAYVAAVVSVVAVFVQLLLGAIMRHTEAGLAVPFFPMDAEGRWIPEFVDQRVMIHMAHRLWAVAVLAAVWRACAKAGGAHPALLGHVTWVALLVLIQGFLGASVVWMDKHPLITSLHVVNGALVLLGCWLLTLRLWRLRNPVGGAVTTAARLDAAGLAALVRPRIAVLVLVITAAGYVLETPASYAALPAALVGTLLVAAAGCALNHFLERDTDARMARTAQRPLVTGALSEAQVSWGGGLVMLAGFTILLWGAGQAATLYQALAIVLYLCVYTPLKRRTSVNTWVGALPGALPVLVGAAAAGGPTLVSWLVFALVFLWQLPHFFAIASMYRDDYVSGGLRMLSGEDPEDALLRWQMPMQVMSVMLVSAAPALLGLAGAAYAVTALLVGLVFLAAALAFRARPERREARRVVLASVLYLPLVMIALVLDVACTSEVSPVACVDCTGEDCACASGGACEDCATPSGRAGALVAAAGQGDDEADDADGESTTVSVAELLANAPEPIEDGTGLPNHGELPEFDLIGDDGQPFGRDDLLGSVWVVDFIFTNCAGPCPIMAQTFRELQNEGLPTRYLSITVDPVRDSPPVLAAYRDNMGATVDDWRLLTGGHENIQHLAEGGFRLPVNAGTAPVLGMAPMFHSGKFALVDKQARLRGYYDYRDKLDLDRLRDHVRQLSAVDS